MICMTLATTQEIRAQSIEYRMLAVAWLGQGVRKGLRFPYAPVRTGVSLGELPEVGRDLKLDLLKLTDAICVHHQVVLSTKISVPAFFLQALLSVQQRNSRLGAELGTRLGVMARHRVVRLFDTHPEVNWDNVTLYFVLEGSPCGPLQSLKGFRAPQE